MVQLNLPGRRVALVLVLASSLVLPGCGGGAGSVDPQPGPAPLDQPLTGLALVKLRSAGPAWVGLAEKALPVAEVTRPERRLLISSDGGPAQVLAAMPPEGWLLLDFALHPSGEITVLLGSEQALRLLRLDRAGKWLGQQDFVDPLVAADPFIGDPLVLRNPRGMQPYGTRDAARLAAAGEDLVLGLRSGRNAVLLYKFHISAGGSFVAQWRSLVEPGVFIAWRGLTGGSFDPLRGLDHQWRLLLDVDAQGRIAVAVSLADTDLIEGHGQHFGEALDPIVTNGVLLSQFSPGGQRLGTALIDTRQRSEPHALRWVGERVAVVGRVRSRQTMEGWDGYLALVPAGATAASGYRVIDVEQGDALLDVAALEDGRLLAAGSSGYTQNPTGASVSEQSAPLLLLLDRDGLMLKRLQPAAGPRHNQLRALAPWQDGRWLLGASLNGPGTHSADGDASLLTQDGRIRELRRSDL